MIISCFLLNDFIFIHVIVNTQFIRVLFNLQCYSERFLRSQRRPLIKMSYKWFIYYNNVKYVPLWNFYSLKNVFYLILVHPEVILSWLLTVYTLVLSSKRKKDLYFNIVFSKDTPLMKFL